MKGTNSFKLIHGVVAINNTHIKIKYRKGKYALDILKFFGKVSLISLFVDMINNYKNIVGVYENIKLWIFGIASAYLVYMFFKFVFKKIWFFKIPINEIVKIEIENHEEETEFDEDIKVEITLINNKGREKIIELNNNNNNQLENFLNNIKKRNTRIKIKSLQ